MSPWEPQTEEEGLRSAWQELSTQAEDKPWLLKLLVQSTARRSAALAARYAL